jgi:DNA-binding MarR family transcriptional regulator
VVNPSSAMRLIDRLGRAGLVRHQRSRADRRSYLVALSLQGRGLVAEVTQRRREEFERLLSILPADQHEPVTAALHAIADAAGEAPEADLALGPGW